MEAVRTISLKINPPREEYLLMMEDGKKLFNDYTKWCYENGTYNKNKIHKAVYHQFVEKYPKVKVALQQSIRDVASACCKREKLKGKPPVKKSLTLSLSKHAFTLRGKQLTLIGIEKRHKEILHVPEYYLEIYQTWNQRSASISYDKKKKQFWLHITFKSLEKIKQISNIKNEKVLGIDRGIYNPIVTSDGSFVGCGKDMRRIKNNYQYLKRQLQKKGTRSAKRKLRKISGKEKRFVSDFNHRISKEIANSTYEMFVLEKLKNIKKTKYSKKFNKKISNWSYFQFELFLKYKAESLGKHIVYIDPAYTSQECSCCGKVLKSNRNKNQYKCECGFEGHADINAALNIKNRFLNSQESLKILGAVVNQPNESKTCSLDSSPHACRGGH